MQFSFYWSIQNILHHDGRIPDKELRVIDTRFTYALISNNPGQLPSERLRQIAGGYLQLSRINHDDGSCHRFFLLFTTGHNDHFIQISKFWDKVTLITLRSPAVSSMRRYPTVLNSNKICPEGSFRSKWPLLSVIVPISRPFTFTLTLFYIKRNAFIKDVASRKVWKGRAPAIIKSGKVAGISY